METTELRDSVAPVVEGLGYSLLDLSAAIVKGTLRVSLVIYRPEGIGTEDCETVHRAVYPRIEVLFDNRDLHVEVSSPGIERTFKSNDEFAIFTGKGVRVLTDDDADWIGGTIVSVTDDKVTLSHVSGIGHALPDGETERTIPLTRIRKAKLDYSQEVK
mgnify:FL=1